jgi:hypothetical protein
LIPVDIDGEGRHAAHRHVLGLIAVLVTAGLIVIPTPASAASGRICYSVSYPANPSKVLARPCLDWASIPANWPGRTWDVHQVLVWNPGQTGIPVYALIRWDDSAGRGTEYFSNIRNGGPDRRTKWARPTS